jgi:hypothetical protein
MGAVTGWAPITLLVGLALVACDDGADPTPAPMVSDETSASGGEREQTTSTPEASAAASGEATAPPPADTAEDVLVGADEAPPSPAAEITIRDEHGYTIAIARSASGTEVWVTYGRPAGITPRVEYAKLGTTHRPPEGVGFRVLPSYGASTSIEHGGFYLLRDDAPGVVTTLGYSAVEGALRRAPRLPSSSGEDAAVLRATPRILEAGRCGDGPCLYYGTDEELRAVERAQPVRREGPGGWRMRPLGSRTVPLPGDESLAQNRTPVALDGHDVELYVVPVGDVSRGRRTVALMARAGAAASVLLTMDATEDPDVYVGASMLDGRAVAWAWVPYEVAYGVAFFDPATGARVGEPHVWRDTSDTSDVDCANALTDTRPIAVTVDGTDDLLVALTWSSDERAILFDRRGRPARSVTTHHPGSLAFYDGAWDIPPIYSLRGTVDAPDAYLEPLPGTERRREDE